MFIKSSRTHVYHDFYCHTLITITFFLLFYVMLIYNLLVQLKKTDEFPPRQIVKKNTSKKRVFFVFSRVRIGKTRVVRGVRRPTPCA